MNVEQDDLGLHLRQEVVRLAKGVIAGAHEDASLQVHDGIRLTVGQLAFIGTKTGCVYGVIGWTDDAAATLVRGGGHGHVLEDLFLVPDVIARGDDVRAEIKKLFRDGRRDAKTTGGVFAVDDQQIHFVRFDEVRQVFPHDVPAR